MSLTASALLQGVPLAVVLVILYFTYIRPQRQQARAHRQMLRDLRSGDQVVTEGGFYARVVSVLGEIDLILELAPNVQIKATKQSILRVVTTPSWRERRRLFRKPRKRVLA
jgi:preprotein translocase subunit YajC